MSSGVAQRTKCLSDKNTPSRRTVLISGLNRASVGRNNPSSGSPCLLTFELPSKSVKFVPELPLISKTIPLQQPDTPATAWHTVSAGIFTMDGKDYLVTVDFLSGFFEVDRLRTLTTAETILKLRIIFARFGSPRRLIMDKAKQFTSKEFATFATDWHFDHKTSSPHYPRSNGLAESAVKSAKNILRKAKEINVDIYQALLDHRNTPRTATRSSPAQIFYQRRTRTTTLPHHAAPTTYEQEVYQQKLRRQDQVKKSHDKSARSLPPPHWLKKPRSGSICGGVTKNCEQKRHSL